MDTVSHGLESVFVYIDDSLVASGDKAEHKLHLHQLLEQLHERGYSYQCGQVPVWPLDHWFSWSPYMYYTEWCHAFTWQSQRHVQLHTNSHSKSLQEFVGIVNFHRWFIPTTARMMSPLFTAVSHKPKIPKILVWMSDMLKVYQDAKAALAGETILTHPHKSAAAAFNSGCFRSSG